MVLLWAIYHSSYVKLNENIEFSGASNRKEIISPIWIEHWYLVGIWLLFTVDSLNTQLDNVISHQRLFMIVYEIEKSRYSPSGLAIPSLSGAGENSHVLFENKLLHKALLWTHGKWTL